MSARAAALVIACLALAVPGPGRAQAAAPASPGAADAEASAPRPALRSVAEVQRSLVEAAFASNLALQRQGLEIGRASAALDAARAQYLPQLSLEARYTRARGGRELSIPAGQLLNPAYQTLNELLVGQGQAPRFGLLTDPAIPFVREREQDTRVTLRQPLYQPAIPAAVAAQRELLAGAQYERLAYAHQLRRDVIVAWLRHLQALRTRLIVQSARAVLDENLRVAESLFRNGRVTEDQVLRARAEQLAVEQQQREAGDAVAQSARYVNFLLNRPLDTPVEDARLEGPPSEAAPAPEQLVARAADSRAELARLDALARAARAQAGLARSQLRPTLSLGVDAGTQGEQYRIGPGYNFIAGSLVLTWKFFDGGARRAELQRARLAERQARLAREETARAIELEVRQASEALAAAADSLETARAREAAARAALRIASRKRDEGVASQLEFIDARDALTRAELNLNLTQFALLERSADLESATGAAVLPPLPGIESRVEVRP